jgi:hypothetical protein
MEFKLSGLGVFTIHIRRSQNKETTATWTLTDCWKKRRKKIRENHSQTGLDVLERLVLCSSTAVYLELGLKVGYDGEEVRESGHDGVKVEIDVVGPNFGGEALGSISCLFAGVLCAHEAGVEDAAGKVSHCGRTGSGS